MKIRPCSSENYKKSDRIRRRHTVTGGFDKIVFATDQDLDGFHIRGLLLGFIEKYLPHLKDKVFMLQTPVVVIMKNSKPERWAYDLNTDLAPKTKESMDYKKGLGSWDPEDLKFIINKDGTISDIKIAQSADPLLNNEALRVVRLMPTWKPGLENNKPCRTMFAIPIEFKL